jgi:molybdopterin-guanine dinucleotide biosynthesis protein A
MIANIFILSEPIQTGKTTLLMNWISRQKHVGGILTPDVNGKRKLYDIAAKQYHDLQLDDETEGIKIGRFTFSESVFAHARTLLAQATDKQYEWIVTDEIGRLEMDRKEGLEPAISELIRYYKTHHTTGNLLLVIRDYLLNDALKYYGVEEATILPRTYFQPAASTQESIKGLVLCGGQSVRMGRDKAFIEYHGKPQCYHVYELLQTVCDDVFISCNSTQKEKIDKQYQSIEDNATFANAGPMTGLLSAFHQHPAASFLVLGCDYPNFTQQDMMALYNAKTGEHDVVCYFNSESNFEEPLLAVYEKSCVPLLLKYYQKGNTSLRHFLKTVNTKYLLPANIASIKSIDTPEDINQ